MSKTAVYPGTFDPITLGHIDVIQRSLKVFNKIVLLVSKNPVKKKCLFSAKERKQLAEKSIKDKKKVEVVTWNGLTVDFMKKNGYKIIIRGLREISDFQAEFQQAIINKKLYPEIETFFVMTNAKYFFLSSSAVKEIAFYKGRLDCFVPKNVAKALRKKISTKKQK